MLELQPQLDIRSRVVHQAPGGVSGVLVVVDSGRYQHRPIILGAARPINRGDLEKVVLGCRNLELSHHDCEAALAEMELIRLAVRQSF